MAVEQGRRASEWQTGPPTSLGRRPFPLAALTGRLGGWLLNALLVLLGALVLVPFYWVVVTAVTSRDATYALPPNWFPTEITLDSFREIFVYLPFGRLFFNSLKVASLITVGSVITSTLAAYAFARLRFPGRDLLFVVLLAALMVPGQVTIIPTFILIRELGLMDTHEAVYVPQLINVFGIFLLRQFFLTIPRELEDAARMDGAGRLRVLFEIVVPLAAPGIASLAIFVFQGAWNEFFTPNLFLTSPAKQTLPVGLVTLQGLYGGSPVITFAGITLVMLPVLLVFLFAQRALTESLTMTGMRG